jgi:hypothetical protein
MEALKKEVADLTNHLNQLEAAEQRRLALEDQAKRRPDGDRRHRRLLVPDGTLWHRIVASELNLHSE